MHAIVHAGERNCGYAMCILVMDNKPEVTV